MLLQVVANAGDVGSDLNTRSEADARDLTKRGVRLLGRGRVNARAHAATLRAAFEGRGLALRDLVLAALADQLLDRGHRVSALSSSSGSSWGSSDPRVRVCRAGANPYDGYRRYWN
ncbi:unannotated protein [freshwater metagenome]|uniref:Unannotated protein n=1 Tax=freshwater metagenome TaxID=449393 RepID=A0A6J7I0A0_9ZZZZ